MFTDFFKESDRVHACPSFATPHQREEWNHQPCGAMVTNTEDSNSDDEDSLMPLLIYPEDYDNEYNNHHIYPSKPPSAKTTP